jgi:Fe-S-cluster containining protein
VVDRVDTAVFKRTYFMSCMECTYCHDSCCQYGVDVDVHNVARLHERSDDIARFTGVPRDRWFTEEWVEDGEFPGGRQTRTRVEDGACVFRNRKGRGCMLHSYALDRGVDYHELKPMVSALFPITFDYGLLHASNEIVDRSLQCIDDGPTLYRGVRDEIGWYFGAALVAELDGFERETASGG